MNHESVSTFTHSPVYEAFNVIQQNKHWFVWPGYTRVRFKRVSLEESQFCDHSIYIDTFLHAIILKKKKKKDDLRRLVLR